jgi:hypothetical protein
MPGSGNLDISASQLLEYKDCQPSWDESDIQVWCMLTMHARLLYQWQTQQDGNERHGAGCLGTMVSSTKQIRMILQHQNFVG